MATNNNGGPKAPKPERLEELIDFISNEKDGEHFGPSEQGLKLSAERDTMLQEVVEALDWTHTMLSNRKVYQKKQQIKKKVWLETAKTLLSEAEKRQLDNETQKRLQEIITNAE